MQQTARTLIGQVLADTYRVESLLGQGGMGAVYLAAHLRLPTRVAIKVLHAEAASNPEIFARFRKEAEIASSLRHPNIVQVYDFNRLPDGMPYLVMEYLEGEDLHARLRERGRLSYAETVTLCRAVGQGLSAAHRREVVHRDLKPPNIFLCRNDQGDEVVETVKVLDFGISKIRHAASDTLKTQDQQLLGTPHYMSPEQARGENTLVDHRTDQWALATILYQCLSGRLAFPGDTLPAIIYAVVLAEPPALAGLAPEGAEAAIRRALSKDRDGRYPSIGEFVRAFCAPLHPTGEAVVTPVGHAGSVTPLPLMGSAGSTGSSGAASPLPHTGPGWHGPGPTSLTGAGGQVVATGVSRRRLIWGLGGGVLGLAVALSWVAISRPRPVDGPPAGGTLGGTRQGPGTATPDPREVAQAADLRPVDLLPAAPDAADPGRAPEAGDRLARDPPPQEGRDRGGKQKRGEHHRPTRQRATSDADDVDLSGIK